MEGLITILIFIGVIAVTTLVFGIWIVVLIIRLILRGIISFFAPKSLPLLPSVGTVKCAHSLCGAKNPNIAQFCRRCGRNLPAPQRVAVRRAAMW